MDDNRPINVEWEDGSDTIADFVHCGAKIVTRRYIADTLLSHFSGFSTTKIEMPDHPNLRRPPESETLSTSRVWLPYDGPELCAIRAFEVDMDASSTISVERECGACGTRRYRRPEGVERRTAARHTARDPNAGLFFRRSALHNADIFRARWTFMTLCTDRVRRLILSNNWSNIEFLEFGDVLDD
jgi:hypothetical protein